MGGIERELVKLYYRIGEVAQIVGVQPHVLRYWETEFRSIRPQKSRKGQRIYSRRDVERLLRVKDLLRNQGFTIAGARKRLREQPERTSADGEPGPKALANSDEASQRDAGASSVSDQGQAPPAVASESFQARSLPMPPPPPPPSRSAKSMRRALVDLRREVADLLEEFELSSGSPRK